MLYEEIAERAAKKETIIAVEQTDCRKYDKNQRTVE
jgi:hypothetical protein